MARRSTKKKGVATSNESWYRTSPGIARGAIDHRAVASCGGGRQRVNTMRTRGSNDKSKGRGGRGGRGGGGGGGGGGSIYETKNYYYSNSSY